MTVSALKPRKQPTHNAPQTLSRPAAVWWRALVHEYGITDPAGELLLGEALAAWDRTQQAEALINRDGPVISGLAVAARCSIRPWRSRATAGLRSTPE